MTKARIYQPTKTAMQSGKAKAGCWRFEFIPEKPYFVDGLMGWTGMSDMKQEIHLNFATLDEAVAYAEREKIHYEVEKPNERSLVKKAYADNFAFKAQAN